LTGTKKMFSYCTARYTYIQARTHTFTQNSKCIMNVSTNVKELAISKLFQFLWVVYDSPSGVILNVSVFITFVSKSGLFPV
jgi:hypothetical protein